MWCAMLVSFHFTFKPFDSSFLPVRIAFWTSKKYVCTLYYHKRDIFQLSFFALLLLTRQMYACNFLVSNIIKRKVGNEGKGRFGTCENLKHLIRLCHHQRIVSRHYCLWKHILSSVFVLSVIIKCYLVFNTLHMIISRNDFTSPLRLIITDKPLS